MKSEAEGERGRNTNERASTRSQGIEPNHETQAHKHTKSKRYKEKKQLMAMSTNSERERERECVEQRQHNW